MKLGIMFISLTLHMGSQQSCARNFQGEKKTRTKIIVQKYLGYSN